MIKTEALLGKLFEDSKSILLVTDELFNIRYVSSSVELAFGINSYSLLGRNAFEFVKESNREAWRKCLQENDGNKSSEIKLYAACGKELYFDVTVSNHVANDEIKGMVVIMHDVTAGKMKHKSLEETNDQLDHFIFKTIHDLRAPIHSAIGLVELANCVSAEEKEKYISLIKSNLQKIESLIDEVADFYKNEKLAIVKEKIDFDAIFHHEMEILQNLPGVDNIDVDYDFQSNCDLFSDGLRIKTILTNVLSNSIKYRDPSKENQFIKLSVDVDRHSCRIVIEDNGMGIEEQHLGKIFDIFFRIHSSIPGTGLGLYIVKDTISRLDGEIEVTSTIGVGTTISISLPNRIESPILSN